MIECIMKRKLLLIVAIFLLVGGVLVVMKASKGGTAKQGELRIDSQPVANVYIDDKQIGRTPYRNKLNVGEFSIKLMPDSAVGQLATWQGKVSVTENSLTYVTANLSDSELTTAVDSLWLEKITSKLAEITVTTSPDGATVLIDNQTKGVTPLTLTDQPAGDHTITITSPGFLTRNLKIKTTAGYRLVTSSKLALTSGQQQVTPEASASGTLTTPSPIPTGITVQPATTGTPSPAVGPAKPYIIIKDTPTGFLRVRMDSSPSATEAGKVNPGQKFTILGNQNGWYEIKYDGTNTGWVSGQYTDKVE
jgi:hypothetical protein